jgi:ABC-type bacteriocin/lantibiotic exporter with double-glycine peptidase domain
MSSTFNKPAFNKQKFLAHEVVQTSAMDCGPAALKSVLEGFGIPVSYGRLREACQTDVDGTSIDTIEDIALYLGLRAEQIMIPTDHLLLNESEALPAIVVIRLPSGLTHFVVVWNKVGKFIQVMDPSTGRRWPTQEAFLKELYIHTYRVSAQEWRAWAGTEGFLSPLRRRLLNLNISEDQVDNLISFGLNDSNWRGLGTLDAATRMVTEIVKSKGIPPGEQAGRVIERFYKKSLSETLPKIEPTSGSVIETSQRHEILQIPPDYWSVVQISTQNTSEPKEEVKTNSEISDGDLILRGAVLIRMMGLREETEKISEAIEKTLPPDLEIALKEPAYKPEKEIFKLLKKDGLLTPAILLAAVLMATLAVTLEAFLLQGVVQIGEGLGLLGQRIWAALILLFFIITPLILEFPINSTVLRMGRRLETRLRILFLEKIPKLGDRYFHSRPTSDMSQRAHDLRTLRALPNLGFNLLRTGFQLILTMIGVIWLDPISAPLALIGTVFFIAVTIVSRPFVDEQDRRLRTHIGALSRFYLDALIGLVPIRTHTAERSIRRQHEFQMFEWLRSGRNYFNFSTGIQSLGTILYTIFSILIVVNYIIHGGKSNEILLLFYWTLSLPALGQSLALQFQQYPLHRNRVLRLLEPLSAPDEEHIWFTNQNTEGSSKIGSGKGYPVSISMDKVWVQAGGNIILKDIQLEIKPGEHIAIVGPSGAGKSSLVGLLLGWHRPAKGTIKIDSKILDGRKILHLRRETAWVDPSIQVWNRSLYENLIYGSENKGKSNLGNILRSADLYHTLELLPDGMNTKLGESGGLVSGGEGQRVRLGRALTREKIRLVILDEPFRGLDRKQRGELLERTRELWKFATLIFISHDITETARFDRVLVMDNGQVIEDGVPEILASNIHSHYKTMLEQDREVRNTFWEGPIWKKLVLEDGVLKTKKN